MTPLLRSLTTFWVVALLLGSQPAGVTAEAPGDVVFRREGATGGFSGALFPHWIHRIRFRCYACHDTLFPMRREPRARSGEALHDTRGCGACHDGKQAFPVSLDTCRRCHAGS